MSYGRGTEQPQRRWGRGTAERRPVSSHVRGGPMSQVQGAAVSSPRQPTPANKPPSAPPARDEKIGIGTMVALAAIGIGVAVYAFSPTQILSFGARPPDPLPEGPDPDSEEEMRRRRERSAYSLEQQRQDLERIQSTIGGTIDDYDDHVQAQVGHQKHERQPHPSRHRGYLTLNDIDQGRDRDARDPYDDRRQLTRQHERP